MDYLEIKILYGIDFEANRITVLEFGELCYIFKQHLMDYEISAKLKLIQSFSINEDKLLSREEFDKMGVNIKEEYVCSTLDFGEGIIIN